MIYVMLGAPIGALLRYFISKLNPDHFPFATLFINLFGAFCLGIMSHYETHYLLIGTGLLGSFTTYSTMSVEMAKLYHRHPILTIMYVILSFVFGPILYLIGTHVIFTVS